MVKSTNIAMKGSNDTFFVKGVVALKPNHRDILQLQKSGCVPCEFGSKIWRASYLLIHYLSTLSSSDDQHFVELGCGWGLPSVYIKKYLHAEVTATDSDNQVRPYQKLISAVNEVNVPFIHQSFYQLNNSNLCDIDILIGADICYSTANSQKLVELFTRFIETNKGEVIIADSGRPPFFELLKALKPLFKIYFEKINIDLPARVTGYILHIRNN